MPNKSLLRFSFKHSLNDSICTFKLLITANNFILSMLLVCCKQGKEPENIHNNLRFNHICDGLLHMNQCAFSLVSFRMPRSPNSKGRIDRTISIAFSFGCKVEDVRHKHLRNTLFVSENISGTIHPRNCFSYGSFQLSDCNRESVYQKHNVKSLSAFSFRIYPLIGDDIFI